MMTPMAGATRSEPTPTAHDAAATTCCHFMASGAAASAIAATATAATLPDMGLTARTLAMGPTDAATELVMRHAATTVGRHTSAGEDATLYPAMEAAAARIGSHTACALTNAPWFTARRA